MERLSAMFRAKRLSFGEYFKFLKPDRWLGYGDKNRLSRAVRLTFELLGAVFFAGLVITGIRDHQTEALVGMGGIFVGLVLFVSLVIPRNPGGSHSMDLDSLRQKLGSARDRVQKVSDLIDEKLESGLLSRIVMRPGVDDGQSSLRDTKVPLEIVQEILGSEYSERRIRDIVQSLGEKDIQAVLCFAYVLLIEQYSPCPPSANVPPGGVAVGPRSGFSRVGEDR